MTGLSRNKSVAWYAKYSTVKPIFDEDGYETGVEPVYEKPVRIKANVSPAKGSIIDAMFGLYEQYDKVIAPLPLKHNIEIGDVFWIDKKPEIDSDGNTSTAHDYVVTNVAKSLNSISVVLAKVDLKEVE